ncbi:4a-hydroxytetrahydrobiopterin dehydratase [Leptospira weilii serovar Ranarum str. ICFT]|uniref:4a-hydroxytetrahydrobiopterin dehydratase n=1 Tax=Leptospira weilii serovar Ranarum str. ICFT TaxID=1218598 RepID=N1WE49_9LEPT|nr:4a-hydroxytetrahydrobiopterin dehydratase [Leptospira weilii]EMY78506.1 4a-hydroxytetrahydrobiopterin dehydratase [Leptospira weilii serovar Ranarum str. ICFT]
MNESELKNLRERIPSGWEIKFRENVPFLFKTFSFQTYLAGVEFVNALANVAERLNHHPDLFLSYRKVAVEIFTHSKNTITDLDLRFAEEAEKVFKY